MSVRNAARTKIGCVLSDCLQMQVCRTCHPVLTHIYASCPHCTDCTLTGCVSPDYTWHSGETGTQFLYCLCNLRTFAGAEPVFGVQ